MDHRTKRANARKKVIVRRIAKSGTNAGKPLKHPNRDYKAEAKGLKKHQDKRVAMNRYNRNKGTYGNGDKKDASHKDLNNDGRIAPNEIGGFEKQSRNRARKA
tara:strand:- start:3935 stop:4243 length:309 start_codon:yes stop_codon:yes gene_type:complete